MKHWKGKTIQEMDQFGELKSTALDGTFREQKTESERRNRLKMKWLLSIDWEVTL